MSTEIPAGADPRAAVEMLATFEANRTSVDAHWHEILKDHEGGWVAAHDGGLIFGATLDEALNEAESVGWPLNVTYVRSVRRHRPAILL